LKNGLLKNVIDSECYNPTSESCAEQLLIKMTCISLFQYRWLVLRQINWIWK